MELRPSGRVVNGERVGSVVDVGADEVEVVDNLNTERNGSVVVDDRDANAVVNSMVSGLVGSVPSCARAWMVAWRGR